MNPSFQIEGVEVYVEGTGPETLVMVHGWPDTWRLWDRQAEHFKSKYRCVRFSLPGFEAGTVRRPYALEEVTGLIGRIVDQVSPQQPVTLLLHDWGCFFGYQYYQRHPGRVGRIIGVDVGDSTTLARSMPLHQGLMAFAYQIWLAMAWLIGGGIGDWMTRAMARALGCKSDPQRIGSRMTYPYYLFWTRGYSGGVVRRFMPECPMLYIYAKRKPVMFHDPRWLATIAAQSRNRVQPFETGHWVMQNDAAGFNRAISDWLEATPV